MHALLKLLLFHLLACLRHDQASGAKIVHGNKAPDTTLQYMVSLKNAAGFHICGGFLISEDFVVTAAHCNQGFPVYIIVGTHNLNKIHVENVRKIEQRFIPPLYWHAAFGRDIMLLKLSKKVELGNNMKAIPLPDHEVVLKEKQECTVSGWGKTGTFGSAVDELRTVNVSVINPQVCMEQWTSLPPNVICAGGYNTTKGFCQGDSGGPLVCNGVAVGVVSFNKYAICDYPYAPNVYTDLSKYLSWINGIIRAAKSYE